MVAAASTEVRSGIIYATVIIVLVFVPLFALSGIEGRLFAPLGIAYIVSILASLVVSITVTPVLCYYLLPRMKRLGEHDSLLVRFLKRGNRAPARLGVPAAGLRLWPRPVVAVAWPRPSVPLLPRSFLPPFNEGTLTISLQFNPGISLAESQPDRDASRSG